MLNKSTSALIITGSLICWIALLSCSKPPPSKDWAQFSPPDGKFSVLLPGEVTESSTTGPGGLVSKTFQVITALSNVRGMAVGYAELKQAPLVPNEIQRTLDQARDQARDNLKGEILSETEISLKGNPGREVQIALPKGNIVRQRIYLANRRLYNIVAITRRDFIESAEAKKFFDSFQILE